MAMVRTTPTENVVRKVTRYVIEFLVVQNVKPVDIHRRLFAVHAKETVLM